MVDLFRNEISRFCGRIVLRGLLHRIVQLLNCLLWLVVTIDVLAGLSSMDLVVDDLSDYGQLHNIRRNFCTEQVNYFSKACAQH